MKDKPKQPQSHSGNLLLISTMFITLLVPVSLILVSYLDIIDGLFFGHIITALAVIISSIFIIFGGLWMYTQDKKDGNTNIESNTKE